jgi:hypothetical protein
MLGTKARYIFIHHHADGKNLKELNAVTQATQLIVIGVTVDVNHWVTKLISVDFVGYPHWKIKLFGGVELHQLRILNGFLGFC